ncbi:hypothetical protein [Cellulosimicrobium protaetiae]|uniref:Uncharacterized protein n=1 Tax=Cellulosimicrobium protaetiae TaxID=2587808 RepID=A0A6M5UBL9_9MICO|nr:hypothetical protein [Cellulosimicrobium protaetiae]QJW35474.1 hypothetical protein FIC82_003915 [Cellulosimicrobium protaetiae]
MTTNASRHARPRLDAARAALDEASTAAPGEAVEPLSRARALLDVALDEAMAEALLAGSSMRSVAEAAGVAPNTVPPRIARTPALAGYSGPDGRVSAEGVTRARYDRERGTPPPEPTTAVEPLRFRRRT